MPEKTPEEIEAKRVYQTAWYQKHKEKVLAKQRATRAKKTPEEIEARRAYMKRYAREWREKNKEANKAKLTPEKMAVQRQQKSEYNKTNKEVIAKKKRVYYASNPDKAAALKALNRLSVKRYRDKNKELSRSRNKDYRERNAARLAKYKTTRYRTNIECRLRSILRSRVYGILSGSRMGGSAVADLGCTIEELKVHLESLFLKDMNWGNWSKTGWHIDHVKPLAAFNLTNREEFLKACHYTNLQPLWAFDNLSKGARIVQVVSAPRPAKTTEPQPE